MDLSRVEYCSTALINALLIAQKRVQAGAGVMKLFGLHPVLQETLQCVNLTGSMFAVYPDEAAAKAAG